MMTNNAIPIKDYAFSDSDLLFLDANVWFYIYGPSLTEDWKIDVYSNALKRILSSKCKIFIDLLVLAEFANRYSKYEYNIARNHARVDPEFKDYRRSEDYKRVAEAIADSIRRILQLCVRVSDCFEEIEIDKILTEFATTCLDFNDHILIDLCKRSEFKLVTHDADFKESDITVLTANKRLLS